MKHKMPIVTPRLILRPLTLNDLDEIQAAKEAVWDELQTWMSWAFEDAKPRAGLENLVRTASLENEGIMLGAFDRLTGAFVLATGVDPLEAEPHHQLPSDAGKAYTTGYWVAKSFQGKGLATEATNAIMRYAFNHLAAQSFFIYHYEGNEGSRRIIEKLGFEPVGISPKSFARCADGTLLDQHNYIMRSLDRLPALDVRWG